MKPTMMIKASTMVKPTTATPATAVWISNMDAIMPERFHVPHIYVYPSTGADDFFDAAVLKATLGRTLVEFYPVAGRLRKDAVNGRIEIECNGEGVQFVEAECDATVQDFGDFISPEISLVPQLDYSQGISSVPLFLVQVTRFRCGGVSLGILFDHHTADGYSADLFLNTWAAIARGAPATTTPFLDRRVLSARSPPRPQFPHIEYHPPPALKNPTINDCEMMNFKIFKVTSEQVDALKAKCQENYSSYETLAGHAWRCVSKARGLPQDQETNLVIPVDGRSRLQPPLPKGYFGNVVFRATTMALCGELEKNPLEFAVRKIHEALAQMNDYYLRSAIDYFEVHGVELGPRARGAGCFKCPNFAVISWARFRFYEIDFRWGRPIRFGFDRIPEAGTFLIPAADDGFQYAIALPKPQMQLFDKLFYDF